MPVLGRRIRRLVACGALAGLFGGCVEVEPVPRPTGLESASFAPRPVEASLAALYDDTGPALAPHLERLRWRGRGHYRVDSFHAESVGYNAQPGNHLTGRLYRSRRPGPKRFVIVLPIWGASTYPPEKVVRRLMRLDRLGDTHLLVLDGAHRLFHWAEMEAAPDEEAFWTAVDRSVTAFRNTVIDVRRLVEWAERRPEIDGERIGIVGFSVGALVAGVSMGVEERLAAGVFMMGGGRLHEVFTTCDGSPRRIVDRVETLFGRSRAELSAALAKRLAPIEPTRFTPAIDPRRVLYFDASLDDCFPESARQSFWLTAGRPERVTVHGRHRWSFLSMTVLDGHVSTDRILAFLDARL